MKPGRHIRIAAHWTSMSAVVVALILTRNCGRPIPDTHRFTLVDESLFQTAQSLSHLAPTQDERLLSDQAIKVADQELDLAYSMGVREALGHPVAATAESKELYARVSKAEALVKADQDQASLFTSKIGQGNVAQQKVLQDQLELVNAQLQLDQDNLEDAKKDLERSGDKASRIQHRWEQHKLEQEHGAGTVSPDAAANSAEAGYDAGNLVSQIAAWYALTSKTTPLIQVRDQAEAGSAALTQHSYALQAQAAQRAEATPPQPSGKKLDSSEAVARFIDLRRRDEIERTLADTEERIRDRQEIAGIYSNWLALVQGRIRTAITGALRSTLWILLVILATPLVARTLRTQLAKRRSPDPELANLGTVGGFTVQALGVLLCLLVIFGFPQQLPTAVIGIVGAGVTVALKDFAGILVDKRIRGLLNTESKPSTASAGAGASS